MTAFLYDEVLTVAPAPTLTVVRDAVEIQARAPKKADKTARQAQTPPFSDPLVDGAARLLSVPLRHVYAALWRAGVLEVQA
jgi:hypothetical protein